MTPSAKQQSSKTSPAPSISIEAPITVEVKAGVFKNTCLELMDEVHAHRKEIVITKHGNAVARLVAPDVSSASAFGFLRGTLITQGDIVSPDHDEWASSND